MNKAKMIYSPPGKTPQAIQTYYDGRLFRSRLEARWAVVFKTLAVPYEYEPEGFNLGGIGYLPDFRVKCYGTRGDHDSKPFDLYIEVKGKMTQEDAEKIRRFTAAEIEEVRECRDPIHEGRRTPCFQTCEEKCLLSGTTPSECPHLARWTRQTVGNPLLILHHIPDEGCATDFALSEYNMGYDLYPFNYETIDGDHFPAWPAATSDGRFYLFGGDSSYINPEDERRMELAYRVARCARFEHGEMPQAWV